MKIKLTILILALSGLAALADNWTNYPFATVPTLNQTFLIGDPSTNYQMKASAVSNWIAIGVSSQIASETVAASNFLNTVGGTGGGLNAGSLTNYQGTNIVGEGSTAGQILTSTGTGQAAWSNSASSSGQSSPSVFLGHMNYAMSGTTRYFGVYGGQETSATEPPISQPIGVIGYVTNVVFSVTTGALLTSTNVSLRFFTNGVLCTTFLLTATGSGAGKYMIQDTTNTFYNNSLTNLFSIQVTNTAVSTLSTIWFTWSFQIR